MNTNLTVFRWFSTLFAFFSPMMKEASAFEGLKSALHLLRAVNTVQGVCEHPSPNGAQTFIRNPRISWDNLRNSLVFCTSFGKGNFG